MAGGDTDSALRRLEQAIDRLDAIAADYANLSIGQEQLVHKHQRLREEVGAAISELDAMIGSARG
jgi:CHASE3 domain sensor protein